MRTFTLLFLAACAPSMSELPQDMLAPAGSLGITVSDIEPGMPATATVDNAIPGSRVGLYRGQLGNGPCYQGVCAGITNPQLIATVVAPTTGSVNFSGVVPATAVPGTFMHFQAFSLDGTPASSSAVVSAEVLGSTCATADPSDSLYGRYEAPNADNACTVDSDCMVSGCSGEVCAADSLFTTCDFVPGPGGSCGCVNNVCIWNDPSACP